MPTMRIVAEPTLWEQAKKLLPLTKQERFEQFHRANPRVYEALVRVCLNLRRRGLLKYSIAGAYEVVRYQCSMETTDPDSEFKLCNDYKPYYARLIMESVPELADFFDTRELISV